MYAIEFEADVKDQSIKIPDYEKFKFTHVKVVVMSEVEEPKKYNFDDLIGKLEWNGNAVLAQREIRNEW